VIDVRLERSDIVIANLQAFPAKLQRAVVRAINRAILSARGVVVPAMAADIGLKQKDIRDALRLQKAMQTKPEAKLGASLKRIPLIKFNARGPQPSRGKGRGVTYKLTGSRERLEQAFIATTSSGHTGVFMRAMTALRMSRGAWSKNLPIVELRGPSLGHVFAKYRPLGVDQAKASMVTNLKHELTFAWTGGEPEALGAE
jgi:hypothetical protein